MTVIPGSGAEGRAELESGLKLAHELGDAWGIGFGASAVAARLEALRVGLPDSDEDVGARVLGLRDRMV